MPLLRRKLFRLREPPENLKPNEQVFQIRYTKEIFKDYEEYLKQVNLYKQRVWACKVSGKSNLTFEEALDSEHKATEKMQQFPKELMEPVLRMVQFSVLRLDDLAEVICKALKNSFVVGEEILGVRGESTYPCRILRAISLQESKGKGVAFQYEVGWLDQNKSIFRTSVEQAGTLMRQKSPFTITLLKSLIRDSATNGLTKNSCWQVHEHLCALYGIPSKVSVPERVQGSMKNSKNAANGGIKGGPAVVAEGDCIKKKKHKKAENGDAKQEPVTVSGGGHLHKKKIKKEAGTEGDDVNKKRKKEVGAEGEQGNTKKQKKSTGADGDKKKSKKGAGAEGDCTNNKKKKHKKDAGAEGNHSNKKKHKKVENDGNGKPEMVATEKPIKVPKEKPIRYPIEDTLVKISADDPPFLERPVPSSDFCLPSEHIGNLLMVWGFCINFSKTLRLSTFSVDDLEKALEYKDEEAPLLREANYALLRAALTDSRLSENYEENRQNKGKVSIKTWKEDICDLIEVENIERFKPHLSTIRCGDYNQLDSSVKLDILHDLVNYSLDSDAIRSQIDLFIEEKQDMSMQKRREEIEEIKKRKEEQGILNLARQPDQAIEGSIEGNTKVYPDEDNNDAKLGSGDVDKLNIKKESSDAQLIDVAGKESDSLLNDAADNGEMAAAVNGEIVAAENGEMVAAENGEMVASGNVPSPENKSEHRDNNEEDQVMSSVKSRREQLKQKAALKQAEEIEREKKKSEEQKALQEIRKVKAETLREKQLQEKKLAELQKKQENYEKEMEKRVIRIEPLGRDREQNKYWFFPHEGRIFIESEDSLKWGYYGGKDELDALYGSLNIKGIREKALQKQLEKSLSKISESMQKRAKEIAQKLSQEDPPARRSARGKQAPPATGVFAYVNKYRN